MLRISRDAREARGIRIATSIEQVAFSLTFKGSSGLF